jgi:hypothetical protein
MQSNSIRFTHLSARFTTATILAANLAFASGGVLAAHTVVQQNPAEQGVSVRTRTLMDVHAKVAQQDRAEQRIKDMHTKLKITPEQEALWGKVAQVMSDNAKVMDTLTQARADHAKEMTAIEDLKSYGEVTDAHADGVKKLIPVFADLYAAMSDAQRRDADVLFRHGGYKHGHKKHGHKKSVGK